MKSLSLRFCVAIAACFIGFCASVHAQDCPQFDTAKAANDYRMARTVGPTEFAGCLSGQINTLPTSGGDLPAWLSFYPQAISTLRSLYLREAVGTEARDTFSADELALRAKHREALANQLSDATLTPAAAKKLQRAYATSVAEEYDLIYRRSLEGLNGLDRAHQLLLEVDPLFLYDQTGKNWASALGTCPSWKPGITTPMKKWCESCRPEFEKANDRLQPWVANHPASEVRTTVAQLLARKKEISAVCGE